ncbi:hypothetical protein LCGC14_2329890, partial [marine sediment metagenome]
ALLDKKGAHPVERYKSLDEAQQGHIKWVAFAADRKNNNIIKLGYESIIEDRKITLERY